MGSAVVLLIISMITFGLFGVLPRLGADPVYLFVGKDSSPAQRAAVEHTLGFDQPIPVQYWRWLKGIFVGATYSDGNTTTHCAAPCLGYSFHNSESVTTMIAQALPVTLSLAIGASIIWLVLGVAAGVVSAVKPRSIFDRVAVGIALAGVSLPVYFVGLFALLLFAYGPPWLRIWSNGVNYVPFTQNPASWAWNMLLPWLVLAFGYAALYTRLARGTMLETLGDDYVRTARAKGLPERTVIGKHALRATLTPIVTIFGLDLGGLLGGALLTEVVFDFHGLGLLSYTAINAQDLPVVMGTTIFATAFIVLANVVVDILYAVVDPRVSYA